MSNKIFSIVPSLSQTKITNETSAIWEHIVSDIRLTLQSTGYQHNVFAFSQKLSLFTPEIISALNLNDKKSLLTLKRATKDAIVMSVPGPMSIFKSVIDHNLEYQEEPLKLFDYGISLVDDDDDITTEPKQLHVFKAECIGDDMPVRDAELILTTYRMLEELGIPNLIVTVNELGGRESRHKYYEELMSKAQPRFAELVQSLQYNPIRLYNELSSQDTDINLRLPQIVDYLSTSETQYFKAVLEFLETLDIPYELDSSLSGSIGFNEGVYFEIRSRDNPDIVLVRGGRHNELFALLGGDKKIGSVGIEIYVDALVHVVGQIQQESLIEKKKPDIFVASIGPEGQKSALKILSLIQKHGLGVKESFGIKSLKQQLLKAKKSDAEITLIVGRKEAVDGTVILRDKESENQEVIPIEKLLSIISQKLEKE
jgi:histidyl-tRNA synthetase